MTLPPKEWLDNCVVFEGVSAAKRLLRVDRLAMRRASLINIRNVSAGK
ncbi:hypothetical protein [Paraburkholderia sediminicola]